MSASTVVVPFRYEDVQFYLQIEKSDQEMIMSNPEYCQAFFISLLSNESMRKQIGLPEEADPSEIIPLTSSQQIEATQVTSATAGCKWHEASIKLMLTLVDEHQVFKPQTSKKKKDIWQAISEGMAAHGYSISGEAVAKKWANMLDTYKKISDKASKTGSDAPTWPWYETFEEILGDRSNIRPNPKKLFSTLDVQNCNPKNQETRPSSSTSDELSPNPLMLETTGRSEKRNCRRKRRLDEQEPPAWFMDYVKKKDTDDKEWRDEVLSCIKEKNENLSIIASSLKSLVETMKK